MNTYLCTAGHVQEAPSMGTFESCQVLRAMTGKSGRPIKVPCGCAVVRVGLDPGLEAAYRIGGADAVVDELRNRIREGRVAA